MSENNFKRDAAEALRRILDDDMDDEAIKLLEPMTVSQLRDIALAGRILTSLATGRANAQATASIQPTTTTTENGAEQHQKIPGSVPYGHGRL